MYENLCASIKQFETISVKTFSSSKEERARVEPFLFSVLCEPARRCLNVFPSHALEQFGDVLAPSPWSLRDATSYNVVEEPLCSLSAQQ